MTGLQHQKDELNETTSKLEKVDDKPAIDEKVDDIVNRYKHLEAHYTDKEKQVHIII